ncbi:hypothetical protein [Mycoplasmopsis felis]|uniref:hypothetical protein n=1 Tax=Mycoplasmopsis felis TaxID=33923 RepID=UPI0021AFF7B6|nr:hypothetical protein [Mycoplasmopsis felis]UWV83834.1 hypothetical protein NWE58_06125 [Mycoplasmopsis felis]
MLEPKIPNKNSSSVSRLIDINSINVSNNTVTVNFNKSVTQEQDLKVLVKSQSASTLIKNNYIK